MKSNKLMNKNICRALACAMSTVIAFSPVTAFAQESEEIIVEVSENFEETVDEIIDAEDSAEVAFDEITPEEVVEESETVETVETPVFDKRALKHLNDAVAAQASLKDGYAYCKQVERCRKLATSLLVFKLKYIEGYNVIGTAYDMAHGDNNYISVHMIDPSTGEAVLKYYDFYMQDSNGNNIDNLFKYYTVDRITIVEKGEYTGEKKIGMYAYPTFASKSNGNVVLDFDSYSELLSDEYIAFVENSIQ